MKRHFLIEARFAGHAGPDYKQFLVKAKTFEAACEEAGQYFNQPEAWKLVAVFELSELDKNIMHRTQ